MCKSASTNNHSNGTEFCSSTTTTAAATTNSSVGPRSQFSEAVSESSGGIMSYFGKVYKGWIDAKTLSPSKVGSGMIVAVKRLNSESVQGFAEWRKTWKVLA
ncbi:hypothetical protein Bca101_024109 [Brassica carinata]